MIDIEEGLGDVGLFFGVDERLQRMGSAIGVPERERGVIREIALADFAVSTEIFTVYVAKHRRSRHRVVHCRVENLPNVRFVARFPTPVSRFHRFDFDFREFLIPRLSRRSDGLLEIPIGQLFLQVQLCIFNAHGRQRNLHQQRLAYVLHREHADGVAIDLFERDGPRKLRHKEALLLLGPAFAKAVSAHRSRRLLRQLAVVGVIPADALSQVDAHQRALLIGSEGVAMHSHALRSREFHKHVRSTEFHGVVARTHRLRSMAELRLPLRFAGNRQQGDVAKVTHARAAQVLMAEADDDGVAVVVARAPVPSARGLRGTELHIAEGHVGSEKHVSVAARADARVHETGVISVGSIDGEPHSARHDCHRCQKDFFQTFHKTIR